MVLQQMFLFKQKQIAKSVELQVVRQLRKYVHCPMKSCLHSLDCVTMESVFHSSNVMHNIPEGKKLK